ncbi:MAG: 6-phosphofructokinase [Deltaproteobacteria bacterium]|nr:6-phosphofructokinase [Deltaproteobacteria bacterium]
MGETFSWQPLAWRYRALSTGGELQCVQPLASLPPPSKKNLLIIYAGGDAPGMEEVTRQLGLNLLIGRGKRLYGALNGPASLTCCNPPQVVKLTAEVLRTLSSDQEFLLGTGDRRHGPFDRIADRPPEPSPLDFFETGASIFQGGIVIIGGGGSCLMAARLARLGVKIFFVGASVDGGVPLVGRPLGLDSSARWNVEERLRPIRRSAASCNKLHIVQVMGNDRGELLHEVARLAGPQLVDATVAPGTDVPVSLEKEVYPRLMENLGRNRGAVLLIAEKGRYRTYEKADIGQFDPPQDPLDLSGISDFASVLKKDINVWAWANGLRRAIGVRINPRNHDERRPPISEGDQALAKTLADRLTVAILEGAFGMAVTDQGNLASLASLASNIPENRLRTPGYEEVL